ncbi:MAG: hypothetical protein DRJ56_02750 [Thermoprotei archaeon]|nr:MAG: hypothetical protein DRJ56_02750 [Thermoprotei archaeon]
MWMPRLVVVGRDRSVESYRLIGASVIQLKELDEEGLAVVLEALVDCKVMLVEEELYEALLHSLKSRGVEVGEGTVIAPIPSMAKGETRRLERLNELLSRAVGVELKWVR